MKKTLMRALAGLGVYGVLALLPAQAVAFQVSGRVTDGAGAAIGNVQVSFLQTGTNVVAAATTADLGGNYLVTLGAGTYDVSLVPPPNGVFSPQMLIGRTIAGDTLLDLVLVATSPGSTAVYSGTLVDRNGAALDGSGLTAFLCPGLGGGCVSSGVTAAGVFAFPAVATGSYRLGVSGYPASPLLPYHISLDNRTVALSADKDETIQIENRTISGSVTGPLGPVTGLEVVASGSVSSSGFNGNWQETVTTTGAGTFQVPSLSGTNAYLTVYPPLSAGGGATYISVGAADDVTGASIVLPPLVTYTATLRDRNGDPPALVTSATLQICNVGCTSASPAADGSVTFTTGAGSNYVLYLYLALSPGGAALAANRTLDLSQSTAQVIDIPDRLLSGVVRLSGAPVGNLTFDVSLDGIQFDNFSGALSGTMQTDANGNYAFAVVPANGTLRLTPAAGSGAGATTFPLTIAGDLSMDLDLTPVVSVDAQLADRSGNPLPAGQSAQLCDGYSCTSAATDAQGRATFTAGPGSYDLRFSGGVAGSLDLPLSFSYLRPITLSQATNELVLLPNRRLSGTVVDPDGIPVGNVGLALSINGQGNGDSWTAFSTATTSGGGAFATGTLSGSGSMQGFPPGGSGLQPFTVQGVTVNQDLVLGVFLQFVVDSVTADAGAGDTVTTDNDGDDGATPSDPIETSVTTPNPGTVSISEAPIALSPPGHYQFLTQQIDITAPPASAGNPLVLTFRMDASRIPSGQTANTLQILRDGTPVANCSLPAPQAQPDPCVGSRQVAADGDIVITVRASFVVPPMLRAVGSENTSSWAIGYSDQPCTSAAECADPYACTEELCINDFCALVPHSESCDDGLFCNGAEQCYPSSGCGAGAAVVCADDGDPCTVDAACDETLDSCNVPLVCPDDNNPCTVDVCQPPNGWCGIYLDQVPCDDADTCTSGEYCTYGYCYATLASLADVGCELDSFTADPPCPGLSADLASRLNKKIERIRGKLERALASTGARRSRMVSALQRKLWRLQRPLGRWFNRGLVDDVCMGAMFQRINRVVTLTYPLQ